MKFRIFPINSIIVLFLVSCEANKFDGAKKIVGPTNNDRSRDPIKDLAGVDDEMIINFMTRIKSLHSARLRSSELVFAAYDVLDYVPQLDSLTADDYWEKGVRKTHTLLNIFNLL